MPPVPEILQEIRAHVLDLVDVVRIPAYVGQYQTSNQLTNTLAHLVAKQGAGSRLLSADDVGRLRVVSAEAEWEVEAGGYVRPAADSWTEVYNTADTTSKRFVLATDGSDVEFQAVIGGVTYTGIVPQRSSITLYGRLNTLNVYSFGGGTNIGYWVNKAKAS